MMFFQFATCILKSTGKGTPRLMPMIFWIKKYLMTLRQPLL